MTSRLVPTLVVVLGVAAASCGGSDSGSKVVSTTESVPVVTSQSTIADTVEDVAPATSVDEPLPEVREPSTGELPADTGPELEWIEVATDVRVPPGELLWTGSSFIIAGQGEAGVMFLQSADGLDWQPLRNLPDDADPFGIHAAGDSIVLWGVDPASRSTEGPPTVPQEDVVLLVSTDGGGSWAEIDDLGLPAAEPTTSYLREFQGFSTAAISGNIVIVVIETVIGLDDERILADNDIDPAEYGLEYEVGEGEVSVCVSPRIEFDERRDRCVDEFVLTFEQLELTDDDVAVLTRGTFPFTVYRSLDGGPFEAAESSGPDMGPGWNPGWLRVIDGNFVGALTDGTGLSVTYRSADGLDWELDEPSSTQVDNVTADGPTLYGMERSSTPPSAVRSDDAGRTWTEVDVGSDIVFSVAGGPAGLAVSGQLDDGSPETVPTSIVVEKDGYVVTFGEDGLTVTEAATGETVLAFGPEEMEASEPPETVAQAPDGSAITFLEPDTLEPLVTITESDLEEAFSRALTMPEFVIGWSADGERWGWQTATETFGANGVVRLAVGAGTVAAMYQSFETADPNLVQIFAATAG